MRNKLVIAIKAESYSDINIMTQKTKKRSRILDADIVEYLNEKCQNNSENLQVLVNDLLRKDIEIAQRVAL